MTPSGARAEALAAHGVAVARVSVFDTLELDRALRESRAEVVIDELTALRDRRLRLEASGYLADDVSP